MANPNNDLCPLGQSYCAPWGRCAVPGAGCPQEAFLPNVTEGGCLQVARLTCLTMPNSFEAAACLRAVAGPYQAPQAMTSEQLADILYFPEAALTGRSVGRQCLSGPGPAAW